MIGKGQSISKYRKINLQSIFKQYKENKEKANKGSVQLKEMNSKIIVISYGKEAYCDNTVEFEAFLPYYSLPDKQHMFLKYNCLPKQL